MAVELYQDLDQVQPLAESKPEPAVSARIASVDTLRGLTILLMIFVNDLGHGAPSWMHHIQPLECRRHDARRRRFPRIPFHCRRLDSPGARAWRRQTANRNGLSSCISLTRTAGVAFHGPDSAQRRARSYARAGRFGRCWRLLFDLCVECAFPANEGHAAESR